MFEKLRNVNKTMLTKRIAAVAIGMGTTRIVRGIVETNVPINSKVDKVTVTIASVAIAGVVGVLAASYVAEQIDEVVNFYVNAKVEAERLKAEQA